MQRKKTSALTITSISPDEGAEGATVTIAGTSFSTIASSNMVTFLGDLSA